jgi:hypothetical protein
MNKLEAIALMLCVEYLHRMPEEVCLPVESLTTLMVYHEAKMRAMRAT